MRVFANGQEGLRMRAGQGRGLESVIVSARQRAASLLESVASGRLSADQALSLWPDRRGDDPDVESARSTLRRHPDASALMAMARVLRAGREPTLPRGRPAGGGRRSAAPRGLAGRLGEGAMATRTRIALVAAGTGLLLLSAYWILATR